MLHPVFHLLPVSRFHRLCGYLLNSLSIVRMDLIEGGTLFELFGGVAENPFVGGTVKRRLPPASSPRSCLPRFHRSAEDVFSLSKVATDPLDLEVLIGDHNVKQNHKCIRARTANLRGEG